MISIGTLEDTGGHLVAGVGMPHQSAGAPFSRLAALCDRLAFVVATFSARDFGGDSVADELADVIFADAEPNRDPADERILHHLVFDQGDVGGRVRGQS